MIMVNAVNELAAEWGGKVAFGFDGGSRGAQEPDAI
jgi:hypothetical protein